MTFNKNFNYRGFKYTTRFGAGSYVNKGFDTEIYITEADNGRKYWTWYKNLVAFEVDDKKFRFNTPKKAIDDFFIKYKKGLLSELKKVKKCKKESIEIEEVV